MSGDRLIIRAVKDRCDGRLPDATLVLEVLKQELVAFRSTTEYHAVWWDGATWSTAAGWDDVTRRRLEDLSRALAQRHPAGERWRLISRRDVFDRRRVGDMDLLLAAMAWGFGDRGYGCERTRRIVDQARGEARIVDAISEMRSGYNRAGAVGVWKSWSKGGSAKLDHVDTAFASKLAYFACADPNTGRGPLIADDNTAWGVWALAGIWDSRKSAACYDEYVRWAEDRAHELKCRPDDIERALFLLGPDVRQIWKRLGRSSPRPSGRR